MSGPSMLICFKFLNAEVLINEVPNLVSVYSLQWSIQVFFIHHCHFRQGRHSGFERSQGRVHQFGGMQQKLSAW